MTIEEAIECLKSTNISLARNNVKTRYSDAINKAITALKKQIPKKPIELKSNEDVKIGAGTWKAGTTVYKCPCCDSFISRSNDYCNKCGQAIQKEREKQCV